MNVRDLNKIVIVSLCDSFSQDLGKLLSQNLEMIFCDTKDLIEYELINKKAIEEFCTKEYLIKSEKRVLKHIASFENVVVSIGYDYLVYNLNILKDNSLIVFLKLPKNFVKEKGSTTNFLDYENRTDDLSKISNVVVNLKNTELDFVCEKVLKTLGGLL